MSEGKKPLRLPIYIGVLLLILGIAAGFAAWKTAPFCPSADCPSAGTGEQPVKIQLVYSAKCAICDRNNSIAFFFDSLGIPYEISAVDSETSSGKALVEKYSISQVPSALLPLKELANYPDLKNRLARQFDVAEGVLVIPEVLFDDKPHNSMFLELPDKTCAKPSSGVKIELFCDFLAKSCIKMPAAETTLREKFMEEMDFTYRSYVVRNEPSELISIAMECAGRQDKKRQFYYSIYSTGFDFPYPFYNALECNNEGTCYFLDYNYALNVLVDYAIKSDVPDLNAFSTCLKGSETKNIAGIKEGSDNIAAQSYALKGVPAFIADCQYVIHDVNSSSIADSICSLHPELDACKG